MCLLTVSVEVNSTLPHSIAIPTPLLPQLSVDVVLVSVFVVLVLIGVIVTLFIWRRRRRPSSEPGACYCYKYNLVLVGDLYYKIDEKKIDNLVKSDSKN